MSRGDRREDIFLDDVDRPSRRRGIKTLAEAPIETTLSMRRIAERLHLGNRRKASGQIHING